MTAVGAISITNVEGVDHGSLQVRVALQQPVDAHAQEGRQLDELQWRERQSDEVDLKLDQVIFAERVFWSRGDAAPGLQAGLWPDHVEDVVHFGRGSERRAAAILLRLGDDRLICHTNLPLPVNADADPTLSLKLSPA